MILNVLHIFAYRRVYVSETTARHKHNFSKTSGILTEREPVIKPNKGVVQGTTELILHSFWKTT